MSPWSVKGIAPEAREAAKAAARRAGMTVGQWLSQTIRDAVARQPRGDEQAEPVSSNMRGMHDAAERAQAAAQRARTLAGRSAASTDRAIERLAQRVRRSDQAAAARAVETRRWSVSVRRAG